MLLLRSTLFNIYFVIITVFYGGIAIPMYPLPKRFIAPIMPMWSRATIWGLRVFCNIRHVVEDPHGMLKAGLPRAARNDKDSQPVLYAAHHESAWETIVFLHLLPNSRYVLKKELLIIPFFGWYLWRMGMVAIDRKAGASALKKMVVQARAILAEGHNLIIFPQGTRSAPGTMLPMKSGVAALYKTCGVPVIPITMDSGNRWPPKRLMKYPGVITVKILPVIPPGLNKDVFVETLESRLSEGLGCMQYTQPSPRPSP